jgi:hypothetical protein
MHIISKASFQGASPSAAAASILARNANGRTEWKIEGSNTTYQQWAEQKIHQKLI